MYLLYSITSKSYEIHQDNTAISEASRNTILLLWNADIMKTQVIVSPSSNGKTTQGIGLVMSALVTPTQPLVALDRGGNYRSLVKYVPDLVYIGLNPGQALPALNRSTSVAIVEFAHRPGMDEETIHYVLETLASLPSPRVLVDDCHTYSKSFLLSLTEIASETIL